MLYLIGLAGILWLMSPAHARRQYWPLGAQVSLAMTTELLAWSGLVGTNSNHVLYNGYLALEPCLMVLTAGRSEWFWKGKVTWLVLVLALSLVPWALDVFWRYGWFDLATDAVVAQGFIFAAVFTVLLVRMGLLTERVLARVPEFWLYVSLVIYFGCLAPFFGLFHVMLTRDVDLASRLYAIVESLFVLRYAGTAFFFAMARLAPNNSPE